MEDNQDKDSQSSISEKRQIILKKSARLQNSNSINRNYRKEQLIGDLPEPVYKKKITKKIGKTKEKLNKLQEKQKKAQKLHNSQQSQSQDKNKTISEKEIDEELKNLKKIHRQRLREQLKLKKKEKKAQLKLEKQSEKEAQKLRQVLKQSLVFDASNLVSLKSKKNKQNAPQSATDFSQNPQQQQDNNFTSDRNDSADQNENLPKFLPVEQKKDPILKQNSDKKSKPIIRRKLQPNKKLFNPAQYQQHLQERDEIEGRLTNFHDKYGQMLEKQPEPQPLTTHWDYVLKEMVDVAEFMQKRKSYFQFQLKKMAKHAINMLNTVKQSKQQKIKQDQMKIKRLAKDIGQIVQRQFWNNAKKVKTFEIQLEEQRRLKEEKKEKLQNLVSQQLKFTQKFANLIHSDTPNPKKKALQSETDNLTLQSSDSSNDSDQSSSEEEDIIINLTRTSETTYKLDNIHYDKKQTNKYQSLEQLYNFAQNFKNETLKQDEKDIKQPYLLKLQLRSYQRVGMNWLSTMQDRKMNGILADEMGLGKTIQTIAMLANLTCNKGIWGPHLIIVPTSIIINWEIEFKKWCPSFKILTYYGSQRERYLKRQGWSKLNHFQVCITTYKLALQDQKMFKRKKWYYMILDEAQHIKNFKSQRWQVLLNFQTRHRLLLTGTPLQNDVGELWSLLHFLMPKVFDSHADFMQWFSVPMQQAIQKNLPVGKDILKKLHSILRPFLLRRLKKDVEKQLPTKQEYIIKCPLSRRQRYLYDEFIQRDATKQSIHQQDFLGLMNIVMQLKKVCNHPDLFEPRMIESGFICERLKYVVSYHFYFNAYKDNIPQKFQILKNEREQEGKYFVNRRKQLCWKKDFSYFLQKEQEYLHEQEKNQILIPHFQKRWKYLERERKFSNLQHVQHYNQKNIHDCNIIYGYDQISFLTIINNPSQTLTLQHIQKFNKINQQQQQQNQDDKMLLQSTQQLEQSAIQEEQSQLNQEDFYDNQDFYLNLSVYQPQKRLDQLIENYKYVAQEYMFSHRVMTQPVELIITPINAYENNQNMLLDQKITDKIQPHVDKFHYFSIRQNVCFPNKKLLMYDCGKLNNMVQLLKKLKDRGDKVLIFTQMSKMLDIFENVLNLFNFTYVRLDGATKIENRQKVVERFNGDPKMFCFISSTRAGGIGINLTGANCVIFYDTDWNPAMDKQAQDRCHRIGQTRNVSIYRLISEATIEENILLKSIQKQKLDQYIMEEGEFNTQFLQQEKHTFNVKDLLGNMVEVGNTKIQKINQNQYEKAMDNVEDEEDVKATRQAYQEEKQYNAEGLAEAHELDKEETNNEQEFTIDEDKMPQIFKYGLNFIKNEEEILFQQEQTEMSNIQTEQNSDSESQINEEEDEEDEQEQEQDEEEEEDNNNKNKNKKDNGKKQKLNKNKNIESDNPNSDEENGKNDSDNEGMEEENVEKQDKQQDEEEDDDEQEQEWEQEEEEEEEIKKVIKKPAKKGGKKKKKKKKKQQKKKPIKYSDDNMDNED